MPLARLLAEPVHPAENQLAIRRVRAAEVAPSFAVSRYAFELVDPLSVERLGSGAGELGQLSGEAGSGPCLPRDAWKRDASGDNRCDDRVNGRDGHRRDSGRKVEWRLQDHAYGLSAVDDHPVATRLRIGHALGQQRQDQVVHHRLGRQRVACELENRLGLIKEDGRHCHMVMMTAADARAIRFPFCRAYCHAAPHETVPPLATRPVSNNAVGGFSPCLPQYAGRERHLG